MEKTTLNLTFSLAKAGKQQQHLLFRSSSSPNTQPDLTQTAGEAGGSPGPFRGSSGRVVGDGEGAPRHPSPDLGNAGAGRAPSRRADAGPG